MDRFSRLPDEIYNRIYKLLTPLTLNLSIARRGRFCNVDDSHQTLQFVRVIAAEEPECLVNICTLTRVSSAIRSSVLKFASGQMMLQFDIDARPKLNLKELNRRLQHPDQPIGPEFGSIFVNSIRVLEVPFVVAFTLRDDHLWRVYRSKIQITHLSPGISAKIDCRYLGTDGKEEWDDDMPSLAGRARFKATVETVVRGVMNHTRSGGFDEMMVFALYDGLKELRGKLVDKPWLTFSNPEQEHEAGQGRMGERVACTQCRKPKLLAVEYSQETCLRCNLL